jgi:hypothetical protein
MTPATEFSCSVKLQFLGYSVEFVSNQNVLVEAINAIYPLADANSKPCEIQIVLQPAKTPAVKLDKQAQFTVNDTQISGKNGVSTLFADRKTMTGHVVLCSEILSSPYLMRHQVINTICYYLLSYRYVTPLHCCAFVIDDHTFVCLGNSGDGKSNLAMAAFEQGFAVLAEDLAFVSGEDEITLHSDCREIHLLGDSLKRFATLKELQLTHGHNGKNKFIVPLPQSNQMSIAKSEKLSIVFIKRNYLQQQTIINNNNNMISLFHSMLNPNEAGFDLHCQPRQRHVNGLSQLPSYEMEVGSDATHFFQLLRGLNK